MRKKQSQTARKSYSSPLLILISLYIFFLLGAAVLLYPMVAEWWNDNHQQKAASGYQNAMVQFDREDFSLYLAEAKTYNQHLIINSTVLSDPFDFDALKDTVGEYDNTLDYDDIMATVEIPEIDLLLPIYHGTAEDTLTKGIGHLAGTSLPVGGIGSHCVLTGHTGLPGKRLFTDIDKLVIGDIFFINIMQEKLVYRVDNIEVILPTDISKLHLTENEDYITLLTCTPYGVNDHRLLVRGTRIYPEQATPDEKIEIEQKSTVKKSLSMIEIAEISGAVLAVILFIVVIILTVSILKQRKKYGEKQKNDSR